MPSPAMPVLVVPVVLCLLAAPLRAQDGQDPDRQDLELPAGRPAAFTVEVELDGRHDQLLLERHSLRAPGAVLRTVSARGVRDVAAPAPSTYRGVTLGGRDVVASLHPRGLAARILDADGHGWRIDPADSADPRTHVVRSVTAEDHEPIACGTELHATQVAAAPPAGPASPGAGGFGPAPGGLSGGHEHARSPAPVPGPCLKVCEIAFDADYEYFQLKGSTGAVVAAIDEYMNVVDFFYARDILATYDITAYVVRTAPFYTPTDGGSLLVQFRDEWNANQGDITRDIAHLMTDKPGSLIEFGGLAYVGVICSTNGYGWSMDSVNIVGHEVGHNWGSSHCHDTTPCNNMCGGCLYIAPNTKDIMMATRASATCLDDDGFTLTPLPPYAHPDELRVDKQDYDGMGPVLLDVLANDHDGNCESIGITTADPATPRGGTVTLSPGTGPAGRTELLYTPPDEIFVGEDVFHYTLADASGHTDEGRVVVQVRPERLAGYWPLDEGAGGVAGDETIHQLDGDVVGASWIAGVYGTALDFDGFDDAVTAPVPLMEGREATITAWVRRQGLQNDWAGILFMRGDNADTGLNFGYNNELRYHWNGAYWWWNSGLVPPNGQWVFVALVIEPGQATMWMHDGAWSSATLTAGHGPETFDGEVTLGHDTTGGTRRFDGSLDDVRLYDHALDDAQLADVFAQGGRAESPLPADGGSRIDAVLDLSWAAGPLATAHHVYVGDDWDAVRTATPASPEYQGSVSVTTFDPGPTPVGTTFWRIDEQVGAGVITGDVWLFQPAVFNHWSLDETAGFTLADELGTHDGFSVGPDLTIPGPTASLGTAAGFDGINDQASIPPLDLDDLEPAPQAVTITTWLRRDGAQSDFAGVIFSRGANTTAGLNFGADDELRYHWNNNHWSWDSGLVPPDGQWVFVAMVVQSSRTTIHMVDGGVRTSATNVAGHGTEEFDASLILGRDPGSTSRWFRGALDDVRIYRDALSPGEVEALAAAHP